MDRCKRGRRQRCNAVSSTHGPLHESDEPWPQLTPSPHDWGDVTLKLFFFFFLFFIKNQFIFMLRIVDHHRHDVHVLKTWNKSIDLSATHAIPFSPGCQNSKCLFHIVFFLFCFVENNLNVFIFIFFRKRHVSVCFYYFCTRTSARDTETS